MPKIAIYKSSYIFFWSFDLQERRHIHTTKGRRWLMLLSWLDKMEWFDAGDLTNKELMNCKR
jgi:hypothetical protein